MPYKLGGGGALQVRGVEVPYKLGGGGALQVRGGWRYLTSKRGGGALQVRGWRCLWFCFCFVCGTVSHHSSQFTYMHHCLHVNPCGVLVCSGYNE